MTQPTQSAGQAQSQFIPLGDWKPDVPQPINDGMSFALNLVPKPNGFYGPERALATFGGTQDTAVFGAALKVHGDFHSVPPTSGNQPRYYVGTFAVADGASRILSKEENGAWQNLSRVTGYNCTASTPWRFANFGNKVLATNRANPIQISDGGSALFADINADIRATDIATVAGFAVGVNVVDAEYGEGAQPFRVWWSAIANAGNWPNPTSDEAINTQSAFRDLFSGGELQRVIPGIGGADAIVIAERKMFRMRYVGPPQIFAFDEIESDQGTASPGSVAQYNESFFFFGHNSFYFFDGANSTPISQGVMDEFFRADNNPSATFGRQNAMQAAIDSENKCYVVSYRSVAATTDSNDRILRFNWLTGKWSNSSLDADSVGYVDSFLSRVDAPRIAFIGQDFQTKRPTGATLEATIESREITLDTGAYYQLKSMMAYVDTDAVRAKVRFRDTLGQALVDSAEQPIQADGMIRFDPEVVTGRFLRCRLRIPAGSTWTAITGILYLLQEFMQGSRRRS